jgi:hypothetical protein
MYKTRRLYESFDDIDFEALQVKIERFHEATVKVDYLIYVTASDHILLEIFPISL